MVAMMAMMTTTTTTCNNDNDDDDDDDDDGNGDGDGDVVLCGCVGVVGLLNTITCNTPRERRTHLRGIAPCPAALRRRIGGLVGAGWPGRAWKGKVRTIVIVLQASSIWKI